jgi:hypothetical protein
VIGVTGVVVPPSKVLIFVISSFLTTASFATFVARAVTFATFTFKFVTEATAAATAAVTLTLFATAA